MRSALIIGAAGQDGRLLTRQLLTRGYSMHGWVRVPPATPLEAECVHVDLGDPLSVENALRYTAPDEVYYLPAFHHSAEDRVELAPDELCERSFDVHVVGLQNVLGTLKRFLPATRLFYAASSHVFGPAARGLQNEQTPCVPSSTYGLSKLAGIESCRAYRAQGVYAATGILFNHESSLRPDSFLSQKVVKGALQARRDAAFKLLLGDLNARVDWGYAPDYVDAMYRILQLPEADDFVVASGELHTVREFVQTAFAAVGLEWERYVQTDNKCLQRKSEALCGDAAKLRAATGWSPTVGFSEMVKKLVGAAEEQRYLSRLLIFIPTYNEAGNVRKLACDLSALKLEADILFCDDGSPDGTGAIIDQLSQELLHIKVIHRPGKLGIGSAHQEGIRYAYEHGYETLVTMDCDFTHQPADVERLLQVARHNGCPVAIGSRYMLENSLPGWNLIRRSLTYFGHLLTTKLLRLPHDATGALRVYDLKRIPWELFESVRSDGYSFFFESLLVLHRNRFLIEEMPIALPARTYGSSKMCLHETARSAARLLRLYWVSLCRPGSFLLSQPTRPIVKGDLPLNDPQGWDTYWSVSAEKSRRLYSCVAGVYRRLAIRRSLNHFMRKHFRPGDRLLHAGCGSGQVDAQLSREMEITAVDISLPALQSYRQNNPHAREVRHGDILRLSGVAEASFDGAYNLGVVEHFTHEQIVRILREMGRTVKPGGKVVIFWPHRRATSVLVLKVIHRLLDYMKKRNGERVRLHPPEVSLLKSREQAQSVVEEAGFHLVEYYFGLRDLLVQAVVVGAKR